MRSRIPSDEREDGTRRYIANRLRMAALDIEGTFSSTFSPVWPAYEDVSGFILKWDDDTEWEITIARREPDNR